MLDAMFSDMELMMKLIQKGDDCNFAITNWNNYDFTNKKDYFKGAQPIQTINGTAYTVDPKNPMS